MDIMQSVKTVLNNYAQFDGRSGRAEFWWWALAYFIGAVIVAFIIGVLPFLGLLQWVYTLALIVPSVAVSIRRFHDIGKEAWWTILLFIPIVGLIIALIFLTKPSEGPNKYGEGPQAASA